MEASPLAAEFCAVLVCSSCHQHGHCLLLHCAAISPERPTRLACHLVLQNVCMTWVLAPNVVGILAVNPLCVTIASLPHASIR